jgi:hypothetical protein
MELSASLYLGLLCAVGAGRLIELQISRRNQRRLVERGARRVKDPAYPWMVVLHASVLAGAGLEVALAERACFPREKACGEGLMPAGVAALKRFDRERQRLLRDYRRLTGMLLWLVGRPGLTLRVFRLLGSRPGWFSHLIGVSGGMRRLLPGLALVGWGQCDLG